MEQTFPQHVDLPLLPRVKVYRKEPSAFIYDEHSRECTMFHFGIYRHSAQMVRAAASEVMTADLYGRSSTPYPWIIMNAGAQPRDPPFFSKSDWVFELFCVTRIAHFYVRATAGLQCAEARESSFATIPVLSGWTDSWARTILSKFDFPQTSPITRKCFSQAFRATFFSVNRHKTKKLKRLDSWKLSWASLREMERWSVSAASSCVLSKNGIFPSWTTTSGVDFRATWATPTRLLSGSDFSEDWKQVGTKGTRQWTRLERYLLRNLPHLLAK